MMSSVDRQMSAHRVVNAVAPIRVCDIGGWTDTWFAGHGKVLNIGVHPCVEVQVRVHPIGALADRIVLDVENFGERYAFDLDALPGRHPLLEAVVDDVGLPDNVSVEIDVFSEAPAGSSTGTSAAVAVALIGALDALTPGRMTAHAIADAAHRVEVDRLGIQSGIQDQLCAAFGGINYIEMSSYPNASVSQLSLPDALRWELERRLVLVYLGRAHVSSDVHERVIARLEHGSGSSRELDALRAAAARARDALRAADLPEFARAMIANTEAQRALHADLVSADAQLTIDVAAANGAVGWKVNGAGGEGGSLTLLCGTELRARHDLLHAIRAADAQLQVVPTRLCRHGLRVWHA
jgi:D-glycero-alpha-D-manno-heptose-7-phosphate kinase